MSSPQFRVLPNETQGTGQDDRPQIQPVQAEVIEVFVRLARIVGQPKSVGEIYGLLYINRQPLPMDEICKRLNLSKGSTSQGLRMLKSLGAVRHNYQVGDRRDFYSAETSLKKLVSGYIEDTLTPLLANGEERLERLQTLLDKTTEEQTKKGSKTVSEDEAADQEFFTQRVGKLRKWHQRAHQLFPFIRKFLS